MDTQTQKTMFSSKTDEWATPQEFYNKLNKEHHFTLDPCCTPQSRKCEKFYTQEDDGLSRSWRGESVFINPPHSKISAWVKKARDEAAETDTKVVMLIPARTDTKYWHDYIMTGAKEIYLIKGRLKFGESQNSAPFPSAVIVFHNVRNPFIHYPVVGTMER